MSEIKELTKAIEKLSDEMNIRFDSMDQRFDGVDKRFDEVDQRFEAVDRRFDEVDQRFEAVDRRFDEVDQQFKTVDSHFDEVDKRFDKLTLDISEQIQNVVGMISVTHDDTLERFNKVDERLDRIELRCRYCNSDDGIVERLETVEHEIRKINKNMPSLIAT